MMWVNYTDVIPKLFGIISGMSHQPKFKHQSSKKFQVE